MANQSVYLFQLQKIDTRMDKINKRKKEISTLLSNRQMIDAAEKKFLASQSLLESTTSELQKIEKLNDEKRIKIEQSEASLYSGSVKNPKELSDLQSEIASLKNALQKIENDQISIMVKIENQQQDLEINKKDFSIEQAKFVENNSQFLGELSSFEVEIAKISVERTAIIHQIEPPTLQIYENLKGTKKGLAVSSIEDRSCSICGTELTPSECQQVKLSSQLMYCPSCGRILYAG